MSTANTPVVTKVWDSERQVIISITGRYVSAQTAANTLVLQSNSVVGANNSLSCVVDVIAAKFAVATANAWLQLEYNTPGGNTAIMVLGKRQAGEIAAPMYNPLGSNATALATNVPGDINLYTGAMDANDSFTIILNCRKNDSLNYAFANVDAPYLAHHG
ncbi:MAG: hypothetical protein ACREQ5_09680 [Candidatus Dormibacteria bacterium]